MSKPLPSIYIDILCKMMYNRWCGRGVIDGMIRKEVYFTEQQINNLQTEKDNTGTKIAELVRRAVDEYFEKRRINKGEN